MKKFAGALILLFAYRVLFSSCPERGPGLISSAPSSTTEEA